MANRLYNIVRLSIVVAATMVPLSQGEQILHQLKGLSGVIESPNYPSTYAKHLNISWIIKVRPGFRISIYFTEFDVEDSYDDQLGGACVYDYVKIKEEHMVKHTFCGSSSRHSPDAPRIQQEILSAGNEMTVDFVSDYSNEDPLPLGFKGHYREKDRDECYELKAKAAQAFEDWDTILYCNHHCNNVPSSYYCSCDPGFNLHNNNHTCTNDCGGMVLDTPTGEITTSRYPGKYSKLAECDWTIQQKEGIAIELQFDGEFSIEKHEDEGCVYDWVQYENASGKESDKYCGKENPNKGDWIFTNSHIIKVTFHSDLTFEEAGFKLRYKTKRIKCFKSPKAPKNGLMTSMVKKYEFEDVVTFQCKRGYRLTGKDQIFCQSDGTWDASEPTCKINHCKRPAHLESAKNGMIKEKSFNLEYGTKVTFLCYIWFEMTSGTSVWKCDDDEEWHESSQPAANNTNQNIPKCEPICGLKGNKDILEGTYNFGDTIPNREDQEEFIIELVVGGKKSLEAEWPWVVFLDLDGWGLEAEAFCGGSLLSPNIVVTAAHCTRRAIRSQIRVYVGVTDRLAKSNQTQVFSVTEVIEHEQYGTISAFDNDIAVLKLNASVKIGKYARPICLPRSDREKELPTKAIAKEKGYQKTGVITGWGITETGWASYELLEGRIPPIGHDTCVKHMEHDDDPTVKVSKNMLCGGYLDRPKDSCKGDSGGPFMFKDNIASRYFLNGIVSFGSSSRKCGNKTFGVYTNVAKYVPWLEAFLTN